MAAPVRLASFHQVPVLSLDLKLSDLGSSPMATPLLSTPCPGRDSLGTISMPPAHSRSPPEDPSLPLPLPHAPSQLQPMQELLDLVNQSSKQCWRHEMIEIDMAHYVVYFQNLCAPLISSDYISRAECKELFYRGFHHDDLAMLCLRFGDEGLPLSVLNHPSSASSSSPPPLQPPPSLPISSPPPAPTLHVHEVLPPPMQNPSTVSPPVCEVLLPPTQTCPSLVSLPPAQKRASQVTPPASPPVREVSPLPAQTRLTQSPPSPVLPSLPLSLSLLPPSDTPTSVTKRTPLSMHLKSLLPTSRTPSQPHASSPDLSSPLLLSLPMPPLPSPPISPQLPIPQVYELTLPRPLSIATASPNLSKATEAKPNSNSY